MCILLFCLRKKEIKVICAASSSSCFVCSLKLTFKFNSISCRDTTQSVDWVRNINYIYYSATWLEKALLVRFNYSIGSLKRFN